MPILSTLSCLFNKKLSVLDFGGGFGVSQLTFKQQPNQKKVVFHVFDSSKIKKILKKHREIIIFDKFEQLQKNTMLF